jgi:hypothetical protein
MNPIRFAVALGAGIVLAACGPDIPDPNGNGGNGNGNGEPLEATWPTVVETFGQSCAFGGCHAAGSPQVVLVDDVAYDNIVNAPSEQVPALNLVEPGDPTSSYLYLKVADLHEQACTDAGVGVATCGERMPPPPNAPLQAARIQAIHDWIADGALEEE